jgi:hypothetical protein
MGALRAAADAEIIESDGMTSDQVLERALAIVERVIEASKVRDCP